MKMTKVRKNCTIQLRRKHGWKTGTNSNRGTTLTRLDTGENTCRIKTDLSIYIDDGKLFRIIQGAKEECPQEIEIELTHRIKTATGKIKKMSADLCLSFDELELLYYICAEKRKEIRKLLAEEKKHAEV